MADASNSIKVTKRTATAFRGAAPKFAPKTLKMLMCATGLYEIYLNGCGQIIVRRKTGAAYTPTFNAASVEHAIALAQSGEIARVEAEEMQRAAN